MGQNNSPQGGGRLGPYELNTIVTGDARILAKAIPDESVDLIFTDPIYQNIDDYRWLAETAARILVEGGNCIAQYAHEYQIEILGALALNLDFVWPLVEVLDGYNARIWSKRIFVAYKPWAWFSRGKRNGGWNRDLDSSSRSKNFHKWGDGIEFMQSQIRRLTKSDEIVLDFFCGGGTVPAVCKMLGRQYLAFEIVPETAKLARQRVANTQPPLFVPRPEQVSLNLEERDDPIGYHLARPI